jgi:CheY-like chemotaxis protein
MVFSKYEPNEFKRKLIAKHSNSGSGSSKSMKSTPSAISDNNNSSSKTSEESSRKSSNTVYHQYRKLLSSNKDDNYRGISSLDTEDVVYEGAGGISIEITDTGAGMSADQLALLFQEGMQFDAQKLQSGNGSGLGLFLARGIVEMHAGNIAAQSEGLNHGCKFIVNLPATRRTRKKGSSKKSEIQDNYFGASDTGRDDVKDVSCSNIDDNTCRNSTVCHNSKNEDMGESNINSIEMGQKQGASNSTTTTLPTVDMNDSSNSNNKKPIYTVLVVDDSPLNRKMICRLLNTAGFRCLEAVDGVDCVALVKKIYSSISLTNSDENGASSGYNNATDNSTDNIDLVLMDFEMPRMNGPTATAILVKQFNLPVFGLTGNVLPEDKECFMSAGALEVLHKPLNMQQLTEAIKILEGKRSISEGKSH